jgi:hypothetical protein
MFVKFTIKIQYEGEQTERTGFLENLFLLQSDGSH